MKTSTLRELPRQIFHPEDAETYFKDDAGQSYRPSNSTEGEIFERTWCADCRRNRPGEDGGCSISLAAFTFDIGEPGYPPEWRHGEDGQPVCTAFEDKSQPRPAYRCKRTSDLFEAPTPSHAGRR